MLDGFLNICLNTRLVSTHLMAVATHATDIHLRSGNECRRDDQDDDSQTPIEYAEECERADELQHGGDECRELLGEEGGDSVDILNKGVRQCAGMLLAQVKPRRLQEAGILAGLQTVERANGERGTQPAHCVCERDGCEHAGKKHRRQRRQ